MSSESGIPPVAHQELLKLIPRRLDAFPINKRLSQIERILRAYTLEAGDLVFLRREIEGYRQKWEKHQRWWKMNRQEEAPYDAEWPNSGT